MKLFKIFFILCLAIKSVYACGWEEELSQIKTIRKLISHESCLSKKESANELESLCAFFESLGDARESQETFSTLLEQARTLKIKLISFIDEITLCCEVRQVSLTTDQKDSIDKSTQAAETLVNLIAAKKIENS